MVRVDVNSLRNEAAQAVERGKLRRAIELYQQLERMEPTAAIWTKRLGETCRRAGDNSDAVAAFERAAEKYVQGGFFVQAIAVCKMILQIHPKHSATLDKLAALATSSTSTRTVAPDARRPAAPAASRPTSAESIASSNAQTQAPPSGPTQGFPRGAPPGTGAAPAAVEPRPASPQDGATARASKPAPGSPRAQTHGGAPPKGLSPGSSPSVKVPASTRAGSQPGETKTVPSSPTPAHPLAGVPRAADKPARPSSAVQLPKQVAAALRANVDERPHYQNFATILTRKPIFPEATPPAMESAPSEVEAQIEAAIEHVALMGEPAADIRADDHTEPPLKHITKSGDGVPPLLIPKGAALDALDLGTVVPGSKRQVRDGGTGSGMCFLLLDEADPNDTLREDRAAVVVDGLAVLRRTPLFSQLPPAALERMIQHMRLVELAPGEALFHRGDVAVSMYVIAEGELTMEGGMHPAETLGPGNFLGEIALITDHSRSSTVRARTDAHLLEIDRDMLRTIAAEAPEIVTALLRLVRTQLADRMTRTSELFRPFTDAQRSTLAAKFELVEIERDTFLATRGSRIDGLYLMVAGQAKVSRDGKPFCQLAPGDVFGQESLLSRSASAADVVAASRVLALRLPSFAFTEVIMTHPQILAYLADLADRSATADEFSALLHLDLL